MADDKYYYNFFEGINIPVLIYNNMDKIVKFVNSAFINMTGYKKEYIISSQYPFDWLSDNNKKENDDFSLKTEKYFKKSNGDKIWIELIRSKIKNKKEVLIFENWIDICKRKKYEESLNNYQEQLQVLTNHLEYLREKERKKIAQEIHDELGQILTAIKMDIYWILKKIPDKNIVIDEKSQSMIKLIDDAIKSVQRISLELRPRLLDDFGLVEAIDYQIKQFIELSNINCKISAIPEKIEMEQESAIAFYRIIQEILTNIVRHSDATYVDINIIILRKKLNLTIVDNGKGIPKNILNDPKSLGLIGIKERVKYLEGTFKIKSDENGTVLTIVVPLNKYKLESNHD